jgi:O-antigen/teichoic acid export membrane protein
MAIKPSAQEKTHFSKSPLSFSMALIAGNSLWNLAGWCGAVILSFVIAPIQIRLLGESHYGLMALLSSIIAPMILLDFGMGEATVKYVAESIGAGDYRRVENYIRNTLAFNTFVGILGAMVIVLLADVLARQVFNIPPESQSLARQCLYWMGATWLINQMRQTFIGAVTARQRYDLVSIGNLLTQALTALAGVGVLVLGGGLLEFTQAQAIAGMLAGLGWLMTARRLFPSLRFSPTINRDAFRRTFGFGLWQMFNNIGGILAGQSQRWLLGVLLPLASVGFYNIGFQLGTIVYIIAYRIGQVVFPAVSQLQGQGQDERAAHLSIQASWMVVTLTVAVLVPMAVFAQDVLALWINPYFAAQTVAVTRILCLASAVGAMLAVPNFYLLGTGRVRWLAALSFGQGIISLAGAAVFIPLLGLAGAGWGFTLQTLAQLTMLWMIWSTIFKRWISAKVYFTGFLGPAILGLLLAAILMYLREMRLLPMATNWMWLTIAGGACALFSLLVLLSFDTLLPGGRERRVLVQRFCSSIRSQVVNLKVRFL